MSAASREALTVLGGGPAGLAVAWYARRAGLDAVVLEAADRPGGNCVTFRWGDFRYDSGAHRFHDKDAEVTADVLGLLGDEMQSIEVPSYIYDEGRLVDFPLSPLNLLRRLGPATFARASVEVLRGRLAGSRADPRHFEEFARSTYGATIAGRFLLGYSEKLWGLPCDRLSTEVAGKRLSGLGLKTFLAEAVGGARGRDRHVDGRFWYPRLGYGRIAERLAEDLAPGALRLGSRVTRLRHDGRRLLSVEVNGREEVPAGEVVSTLPLSLFLALLDPAPAPAVLELARSIRYRSVLLVALFLARPSIGDAGTVYFPHRRFPFTRVYEPRNRSEAMSPQGFTSLVAEIPCDASDALWRGPDDAAVALVRRCLEETGWISARDVVGTEVRRLAFAYPVLEVGHEDVVRRIQHAVSGLANVRFSGRSGRFVYSWLHEMLRFGRDIVAESVAARGD